MSENQNWQEQLQQKAGELIAKRLGTFAEELQQVQTILNDLCQRLPNSMSSLTAEEAAGLQESVEQVRQQASQAVQDNVHAQIEQAKAETEQQVRAEYETQLQDLRTQLENAQQAAGGLGLATAGATGYGLYANGSDVTKYDHLKTAITEIDAQRQQADVLATLVRHAAAFAPRAVFFVIKGGNAIGWKATGFSNGLTDETVRALNIPVQSNGLLNQAVSELQTATAQDSAGVLGNFSSGESFASVAVPLVIRGKAAAILFADSGSETDSVQLDALQTLMQVTSMAIELLPVRRSQPVAAQPAAQPVPTPAPPAQSYQEVQSTPEPVTSFAPQVVTPLPVAVEAPAEQHQAQTETVAAVNVSAPPPINPQSDDEVRAHNDARRFARLLVSEIKLYNEQKVMEGRRANDLYERLKEDIDRSRQMYEKRVSSAVAAKYDYFYDELLHTLGEGDAAKLGRGCPGPTVPVN